MRVLELCPSPYLRSTCDLRDVARARLATEARDPVSQVGEGTRERFMTRELIVAGGPH
jgi:hypothetical protein